MGKRSKRREVKTAASNACRHTDNPPQAGRIYDDFMASYQRFEAVMDDGRLMIPVETSLHAMVAAKENHPQAWASTSILSDVFLRAGTNLILRSKSEGLKSAKFLALGILLLEDDPDNNLLMNHTHASKGRDLVYNDDRTVLRFFNKRTNCTCLAKKYRELKSTLEKTTMCFYCRKKKPYADILECSSCKIHQYCSEECQRAAYPSHKEDCRAHAQTFVKQDETLNDMNRQLANLGISQRIVPMDFGFENGFFGEDLTKKRVSLVFTSVDNGLSQRLEYAYDDPLKAAFKKVANLLNIKSKSLHFGYRGRILSQDHTPMQLEMFHKDVVYVSAKLAKLSGICSKFGKPSVRKDDGSWPDQYDLAMGRLVDSGYFESFLSEFNHEDNCLTRINVQGPMMNDELTEKEVPEERLEKIFKAIASIPSLREIVVDPSWYSSNKDHTVSPSHLSYLVSNCRSVKVVRVNNLYVDSQTGVGILGTAFANTTSLETACIDHLIIGNRDVKSLIPMMESLSRLSGLKKIRLVFGVYGSGLVTQYATESYAALKSHKGLKGLELTPRREGLTLSNDDGLNAHI